MRIRRNATAVPETMELDELLEICLSFEKEQARYLSVARGMAPFSEVENDDRSTLKHGSRNSSPGTRNPEPGTRNSEPETRNLKLGTRNPRPPSLNFKPELLDPQSNVEIVVQVSLATPKPKIQTRYPFAFR